MKELREYMLEGKRHSVCDVCYIREDRGEESPRKQFNDNLSWKMLEVERRLCNAFEAYNT